MPHRQRLLDLLVRYAPQVTDEERSSYDRLVEFVNRRPDCFERSLTEGHITGSAWILNPEKTACLLTHHKKLGKWLQCGGHADGCTDVFEVALREATEESGIEGIELLSQGIFDVDVHPIPANSKEPEHHHYDVRFALIAPTTTFVVSDESHALAWVALDELPTFDTDVSVRRMASKWAAFVA